MNAAVSIIWLLSNAFQGRSMKMQQKDRKKLVKILVGFGELHDKEISDIITEIFFQTLSAFSIEDIEQAAGELVKRLKFFPKPADFIEILDSNEDELALLSWVSVCEAMSECAWGAVRFDDPATGNAVKALGGHIRIKEMDERAFGYVKNDFIRLYKIYRRRGEGFDGVIPSPHSNSRDYLRVPAVKGTSRALLSV